MGKAQIIRPSHGCQRLPCSQSLRHAETNRQARGWKGDFVRNRCSVPSPSLATWNV